MFTSKETFLRKPLQWRGVGGGVLCCLIAQSVGTAASCLELAARRRQVFGIEEGSGRTAGIQSAIADQYGVLTESSGEVGAGGGMCRTRGAERLGEKRHVLHSTAEKQQQQQAEKGHSAVEGEFRKLLHQLPVPSTSPRKFCVVLWRILQAPPSTSVAVEGGLLGLTSSERMLWH